MATLQRPPYSMQVFWSEDDNAFIAICPEVEGVTAFGGTPAKAAEELAVALDAAVNVLREDGDPLPPPITPSTYSGQFRLRIPRTLHARLAADAQREGMSLNALILARLAAADAAEDAVRRTREEMRRETTASIRDSQSPRR